MNDVRIPSVSVVFELESTPQIRVHAESEADRIALARWIRQCRPDADEFLCAISDELHERKKAA